MALNSDALTTAVLARLYLRKPSAEVEVLELLINSVSRAIRRFTGRQFLPSAAAARKFRYEGDGYLSFAKTELLGAPTSIVLYTDLPTSAWVTLDPQSATVESLYRLEPRNMTEEGTYLWLVLPELGVFNPFYDSPEVVARRRRVHQVTVTGTWGAGSVPADVELACLMAVADNYRNPEGFAQRSIGALTFNTESMPPDLPGRSLPADARALLAPYRRISYV